MKRCSSGQTMADITVRTPCGTQSLKQSTQVISHTSNSFHKWVLCMGPGFAADCPAAPPGPLYFTSARQRSASPPMWLMWSRVVDRNPRPTSTTMPRACTRCAGPSGQQQQISGQKCRFHKVALSWSRCVFACKWT
jgi:hypothetical protein